MNRVRVSSPTIRASKMSGALGFGRVRRLGARRSGRENGRAGDRQDRDDVAYRRHLDQSCSLAETAVRPRRALALITHVERLFNHLPGIFTAGG